MARRSIRLIGMVAVVFGCGQVSAFEEEAAVAERCAKVRDTVVAEVASSLLQSVVSRRHPSDAIIKAGQRVDLAPGEHLHVLSDSARVVFSTDPGLQASATTFRRPSVIMFSRRAVFDRAVREHAGTASYYGFDGDMTRVVRRSCAWVRWADGGEGWVMLLERDVPIERTTEAPLMGKWIGAYSHSAYRVAEEGKVPVVEHKGAGQLSALIATDGPRLLLRCVAPDWQITTAGIIMGTRFTSGNGTVEQGSEPPAIWFAEGTYAPEEDRIRGTLHTTGPHGADTRTFFLQPVVPLPSR